MYLAKTPRFIQNLFPNFVWNIPGADKEVYLTFDDGPIPQVTPWVLNELAKYDAKATFFCVGENIEKYPDVFQQVKDAGHTVGSHTYNHLNGWLVSDNRPYYRSVKKCAELVDSPLFRPPYGKLKPKQAQLLQRHYRIIMWDVLSGDFDPNISPEQCLRNVTTHAKSGSIIVFHDSIKAKESMTYALPRALEYLSEAGYTFKSLTPEIAATSAVHSQWSIVHR